MSKIGQEIIGALEDFSDALDGGEPIERSFRVTRFHQVGEETVRVPPLGSPWRHVDPQRAEELSAQLHRELSDGHALNGRAATALAYREDCDDVLFAFAGSPPTLAVVHLTWRRETLADFPGFAVYASIAEWLSACDAGWRDESHP